MLTRPSERAQRVMLGLFVLVILGLLTAEVATDYTPAKLTALFCVVFWLPLLVIHELGHAVVAHVFGCRVLRVSLGFGSAVWSFRVGSATVDVRALPIEGFVRFVPGRRPLSRAQNALIYFAGPGSELLLAAIVVLAMGPARLLSHTENIPLLAMQSLCLSSVLGAALNLVPHITRNGLEACTDSETSTPNDGMGILLSLFGRRDD